MKTTRQPSKEIHKANKEHETKQKKNIHLKKSNKKNQRKKAKLKSRYNAN
jgi:hypothetical protein